MKNESPFDEYVRSQFKDLESEVPDRVWNNIVATRRKSKPKGFWFMVSNSGKLIIAAIILSTGAGFYFWNHSHNTSFISSQMKAPKTQQISSGNSNSSNPNNNEIALELSHQITVGPETNKQSSPGDRLVMSPISEYSLPYLPGNKHIDRNKDGNPFKEYSSNLNESNADATVERMMYTETNLPKGNELHSFSHKDNSPGNVLDRAEKTLDRTTNRISANFARTINTGNVIKSNFNFFPNCPTLERNAAGNKKYWEIYAGPDYVFNDYKNFGDTGSYTYLQKRKASTQFTSAFSAGVRYTRVFENGMAIRSGLNYSQVNEKFNYINPNELKFVTVITKRVVVRSVGDTIYFNDTLQYQQAVTHIKTTYNHYRNIDIPISIGYELGNGKIHANLNAGVIINVYSWYKGDVLDTSYQPVTITTGKGSSSYQYKTNIGVGFLGSFSLYYKMSDKFHLLLEPYFRYNLSPMSKENLNIQQKNHTAGVRLGVRFDLQ